jgi:hypothetical protein
MNSGTVEDDDFHKPSRSCSHIQQKNEKLETLERIMSGKQAAIAMAASIFVWAPLFLG